MTINYSIMPTADLVKIRACVESAKGYAELAIASTKEAYKGYDEMIVRKTRSDIEEVSACDEALALIDSKKDVEVTAWKHSATGCLSETEDDVQLGDADSWAIPLYEPIGYEPNYIFPEEQQ